MKKILCFVTLAIMSMPALADVAPSPPLPPDRGFWLAEVLIVLAVLAVAGFAAMRRRQRH